MADDISPDPIPKRGIEVRCGNCQTDNKLTVTERTLQLPSRDVKPIRFACDICGHSCVWQPEDDSVERYERARERVDETMESLRSSLNDLEEKADRRGVSELERKLWHLMVGALQCMHENYDECVEQERQRLLSEEGHDATIGATWVGKGDDDGE